MCLSWPVLQSSKKIYFASDFHLGVPNYEKSRERENRIIRWLNEVSKDAQEIYLVGDLFDFWFEYKTVVPKGYVRFLGALAQICDQGIPVHVFIGNHDMWMFDYLEKEIGVIMHREPITKTYNDKTFYIGHGDGLGPGDHGYKFIKRVFANPLCQWLFARIHPNLGVSMANFWSRKSRASTGNTEDKYLGDDKEFLVQFCTEYVKHHHVDYFIFGHRHLPIEKKINKALYLNLGDWITYNTYAVFDGENLELKRYK